MTFINSLINLGLDPTKSKELVQISIDSNVAATGSVISQAATSLLDVVAIGTSTSATADAFRLRDFANTNGVARVQYVINRAAAQVRVFCPSGGSMNGVLNGSATLTSGSHGQFVCLNQSTNDYHKL